MTCGRVNTFSLRWTLAGAAASHSAELVRGYLLVVKAPSSAPSGHLLPKGRRASLCSAS